MSRFCDQSRLFVVLTLTSEGLQLPGWRRDLHVERTSRNSSSWCSRGGYFCYRGATGEKTAERNLSEKCEQLEENGTTKRLLPVPGGGRCSSNLSADLSVVFSPTKRGSFFSKLSRRGVLSFRMSDWDKGVWGAFPSERWVAHVLTTEMKSSPVCCRVDDAVCVGVEAFSFISACCFRSLNEYFWAGWPVNLCSLTVWPVSRGADAFWMISVGFVSNNVLTPNNYTVNVSDISERVFLFVWPTAWSSGHLTEPFKFPSRENGLCRQSDHCCGVS